MDALTLDPSLFPDGLIETEEEWARAVELLTHDTEFLGRIGRLLRDGLEPTDLFGAPLWIPEEWTVRRDDLEPGTKISVTAAGQVEGYFFEWGECVIRGGGPGDCWTPPSSPSGYEPFHQSDMQILTAAGKQRIVPGGMIGIGGHAPQNASFQQAVRHYQYPSRGRMIGRLYENEIGGYFRGGLMPQATLADVALIRASALSGHWEYREQFHDTDGRLVSGYDCLGPCMVTRPGLPLTRETRYRGDGVMVAASVNGAEGRWPRRILSSIAAAALDSAEDGFLPDGAEVASIEIGGDSELIEKLQVMLAAIEWMGDAGTSRTVSISIDGDGADRLFLGGLDPDLREAVRANLEDGLADEEEIVVAAALGYDAPERPTVEEDPTMKKITLSDGRTLEEHEDGTFHPVTADGGSCPCGGHANDEKDGDDLKVEIQTAAVSDEAFSALQSQIEGLASDVAQLLEMAVGSEMASAEEGAVELTD